MSIILARLPPHEWSYGTSLSCARHCRLDPSSGTHGAYVDDHGVLHYQHIDAAARATATLLRFQLQYRAADELPYEPITKPWSFQFVPGMPGDIMVVQEGSCRILYASFPKQGADSSDVFLFGSHTAPICCFSTNGNVVISGCQDGALKLWRLSDGQLADMCTTPDKSSITAITCLGPLLVAIGTSSSSITLYDTASGRLLAVHRLMAGPGEVQCMAAWLPPKLLAAANLAPGGPLAPDGGGVLAGLRVAAAHPRPEGSEVTGASQNSPQAHALLAVASSSGWLCVFEASQPGAQGWALCHSTGSLISPGAPTHLAFSPDGSTLAVASPVAQLVGPDAVAVVAAGGQPGAVSLYQVASGRADSSSSALAGLLPPLLLEQQQRVQLPELLLWHSWSLCSMPAGLLVLPSSGFKLLRGKQLQPTQVLQLYVVPEVGPGQVLCAERQLPAPQPSSQQEASRSQPQHQQQQQLLQAPHLSPPAASSSSGPGSEIPAAAATAVDGPDKQRETVASSSRTATVPVTSKSSQSSRSWQGSDVDEVLLFNAAERDLAEVADAIAAAAGPLQDAELAALLADVTADIGAGSPAGYAAAGTAGTASEAAAAGNWSSELGDTAADHDRVLAMQTHEIDSSTSAADMQQQHQEYQQAAQAPPAAAMTAAADSDAAAAAAAAAGIRLPQTLPAARSWMDTRSTGMVGGAADVSAEPLDLSKLARELQQEQERLRKQQQHDQAHPAASSSVAADAPGAGGRSSSRQHAGHELPSESSFQHLLQQHSSRQQAELPAEQLQQQPAQQQQQQQPAQQQQQQAEQPAAQVAMGPCGPEPQHSPDSAGVQVSAAATTSVVAAAAAAGAAVHAGAGQPASSLAGPSAATAVARGESGGEQGETVQRPSFAAGSDSEPRPRQLPAMLRQQAATRAAPKPVPAALMADQSTGTRFTSASGMHDGGSSSSKMQPAGLVQGRQAAVAAAHVEATRPGAAEQAAAAAAGFQVLPDPSQQQQQREEQQLWQQQGPALQQQQPQPERQQQQQLSAQQRLSIRRQQLHAHRQQQQQQQQANPAGPAAVRAAAAGSSSSTPGQGALQGQRSRAVAPPSSDHPLAVAVQNSSRLLAAKIQEAEQAPNVTVDPSGPAALKLAAARLAELDLAPDQQQYCYEELPDLKDVTIPTQAPRLVPKQLDAHWVASRSLKPCMDTLFKPQDWQQGFVDPQVLVLPSWPTPQQVVQQLLWPGQRPGVGT